MLCERMAKKANFKIRKKLSRPRGLAWGPHTRKPGCAKPKSQEQPTREVAWWHCAERHDCVTLVPCAIKL